VIAKSEQHNGNDNHTLPLKMVSSTGGSGNGGRGGSGQGGALASVLPPLPGGKAAADAGAFAFNVVTSVLIVFVNKVLMDPRKGYGFTFATTLCALHFLAAAGAVAAAQAAGLASRGRMPLRDAVGFAVIASVSIASLNVSLLVNSVGFYQVAKLLIIPFVCGVEALWLGRRFPPRVVAAIAVVVGGVALVTLSEARPQAAAAPAAQAAAAMAAAAKAAVASAAAAASMGGQQGPAPASEAAAAAASADAAAAAAAAGAAAAAAAGEAAVGLFGLAVAGLSVATSGLQQIMCGVVQRRHRLQSHELLAVTAPIQGLMLLVVGPTVDRWVSGGRSVLAYAPPVALGAAGAAARGGGGGAWLLCLSLSCVVAVGVNLSQFACLGRFSAVTFQVLGHTKTVLVLLASWALLGEPLSPRKACGMALAVAGMVAYGALSASSGAAAGAAVAAAGSAAVGLGKARDSGGGVTGGLRLLVGSGGRGGGGHGGGGHGHGHAGDNGPLLPLSGAAGDAGAAAEVVLAGGNVGGGGGGGMMKRPQSSPNVPVRVVVSGGGGG